MKAVLTQEYIINGWLKKYHDITIEELIKKEPELCKSDKWYKKYPVTQAQHDEWYNWSVSELGRNLRMPKIRIKKIFQFEYLNVSPSIKE